MTTEIPAENEDICPTITDEPAADTKVYECHICGYKPRPSASNPKEALRKHMFRYHKNADTDTAVDAIVEDILESSSKENECSKLYEDIEILKVKFPDIPYNPDVHPPERRHSLGMAPEWRIGAFRWLNGACLAKWCL